MTLEQVTTADFVRLPETLSLGAAHERLHGHIYGVVMDEREMPVTLITAADLQAAAARGAERLDDPGAGFPPTVIVGVLETANLADSGAFTALAAGARGAIVMDDDGIIGVLPAEALTEHLGAALARPITSLGPPGLDAAAGLGGRRTTPRLRIRCSTCGFANTLRFLNRQRLPDCQRPIPPPHQLGYP